MNREESGGYFFVASVAAVAGVALTFGLPDGATRMLAAESPERHDAALREAFKRVLGVSFCGIALSLALTSVYWRVESGPTATLVLLAVAIGGVLAVQQTLAALLRLKSRIAAAEIYAVGVPLLFLLATLGFLSLGSVTAVRLSVVRFATEALGVVALVALTSKLVGTSTRLDATADEARAPGLFRIASAFWVTTLAWLVLQQSDVVVLGLTHGQSSVGFYAPVLKTADLAALVGASVGTYLLPRAVHMWHQAPDASQLNSLYVTASKVAYTFAVPLIGPLVVAPDRVMVMVFGIHHPALSATARLLAAAYWLNAGLGFNGVMLQAVAPLRVLAVRAVVGGGIGLAANLVFIPRLGIVGAGAGSLTGYAVFNLINSWLLYRLTSIRPCSRAMLPIIITSLLALALGWWGLGHLSDWIWLGSLVLVIGVPTAIAAWLTTHPLERAETVRGPRLPPAS